MRYLVEVDWVRLFRPEMSLLEIVLRGSIMYVALCLLLRMVLKRQAGKVGLADLLVVSVIAGVCRNPLIADSTSITDGLAVVSVVLLWGYALDWLSFYSPWAHRLLHPDPVILIDRGEIQQANLKQELMTVKQLLAQIRQHGVEHPAGVSKAILESSGHVSVIRSADHGWDAWEETLRNDGKRLPLPGGGP